MIEGQGDPELEDVDNGGEGTPWLKKKELKEWKVGDKKSWDSTEQERETYVTLNQW